METMKTVADFYYRVTDLWKRFCEEHTTLLDLTYQEYSMLLSSEVDELEELIEKKNKIIERVGQLDRARQHVLGQLNKTLKAENKEEINNVAELLAFMKEHEEKEQKSKHLSNFNSLLIDLIEKLKDQNKKNQLFLNKAITSLKSIQHNALGKKSYSTYSQTGRAQQNVVP